MTARVWAWLYLTMAIFTFMSVIYDAYWAHSSSLNALINMDLIKVYDVELGIFQGVPAPNLTFLKGIWDLLSWNFSFLHHTIGTWLRFFILEAATAKIQWAILTTVTPIVISALSSVISALRSLNPLSWLRGTP